MPEFEYDDAQEAGSAALAAAGAALAGSTASASASAGAGTALAGNTASASASVGAVLAGSCADPSASGIQRSVEDMVDPVPVAGAARAASLGRLCIDECKAQDFEDMVNLMLMSGAFPERPAK